MKAPVTSGGLGTLIEGTESVIALFFGAGKSGNIIEGTFFYWRHLASKGLPPWKQVFLNFLKQPLIKNRAENNSDETWGRGMEARIWSE